MAGRRCRILYTYYQTSELFIFGKRFRWGRLTMLPTHCVWSPTYTLISRCYRLLMASVLTPEHADEQSLALSILAPVCLNALCSRSSEIPQNVLIVGLWAPWLKIWRPSRKSWSGGILFVIFRDSNVSLNSNSVGGTRSQVRGADTWWLSSTPHGPSTFRL
jgi:hypothetical protein